MDVEISSWSDVVEMIRKSPEKEIDFSIERDGNNLEVPSYSTLKQTRKW